jgi:hypothetical protein
MEHTYLYITTHNNTNIEAMYTKSMHSSHTCTYHTQHFIIATKTHKACIIAILVNSTHRNTYNTHRT